MCSGCIPFQARTDELLARIFTSEGEFEYTRTERSEGDIAPVHTALTLVLIESPGDSPYLKKHMEFEDET